MDLNKHFHFLVYCEDSHKSKFQKGLEFLKTLNLSETQYATLGGLMELYGEQEKSVGEFNEINRNRFLSECFDNEY